MTRRRRLLRQPIGRSTTSCERCGRPVHPNRDSEYCSAYCAKQAREQEEKFERVRASARRWLWERQAGARE